MIKKLLSKKISYSPMKRKRKNVRYIVIHGTGNEGDTAYNNAKYFATNNTRQAGAHFAVGKKGAIYKMINLNRIAWSVGGDMRNGANSGLYYGVCTNSNSVSIELCDSIDSVSDAQVKAIKKTIKYIRRYCRNAKVIIRHWDVNGKNCPANMCGVNNARWLSLKKKLK